MAGKADVGSVQAIEAVRVALAKFGEKADACLAAAEAEGARTLTWLETEQLGHWRRETRRAEDELERAADAYRQKTLYKDATGHRSSGVDERAAMDRWRRRLEECRDRHAATKRHIVTLRREVLRYNGRAGRLTHALSQELPVTLAELMRAVDALEGYAAVQSEAARAADTSGGGQAMSRQAPTPAPTPEPAAVGDDDLRARTPGPEARGRAARGEVPATDLPGCPAPARQAAEAHAADADVGRYDLLTIALPASPGRVYLERIAPANEADTGWHVGDASGEVVGVGESELIAVTAGRFAAMVPHLAALLPLPVGTLAVAEDGVVRRVVAGDGGTIWEDDDVAE